MAFASGLSQRAAAAVEPPISGLMQMALAQPDLISLAAGFVDQASLPVPETQAAIADLLAELPAAHAALQYGSSAGSPRLRRQLLDRFVAENADATAKTPPSLDQVLITTGSNELLYLLCETLLDPGDIVLCASPTYFVFLGTVAYFQGRSIGIDADREGMLPAALDGRLTQLQRTGELERVKAVYLVSDFENPTGATLPADRRAAIVEIARRWSHGRPPIYVIEDAAYRELRYEGTDLSSLRAYDDEGETVVVAKTFSKSFSPGLRVGYGLLPPALVAPLLKLKGNLDFGSPNFAQHVLSRAIERGLLDSHLVPLRQAYGEKRQAMLEAAEEHFAPIEGVEWNEPDGGLYVWMRLPPEIDAGPNGSLLGRALDEGVLYVPGEFSYPREGPVAARHTMRLSFGVQPAARIRQGMAALARAVRSLC